MRKNRNEMSKEEAEREAKRIFKEEARKAGYHQFSKDPEIDREMNEFFEEVGRLIVMVGTEAVKKAIQFFVQKLRLKGNKAVGDGSVAKEGLFIGKQYCCENCGRDLNKLKTLPFQFKNQVVCPECFKLLRNREGGEPLIQRENE